LKYEINRIFENIHYKQILKQIEKRIKDKRIIDELYKMIKVKIINFKIEKETSLEVPQGSVLSPFLFNIYMHNLDSHFHELIKQKEKTSIKKANPLYANERIKLLNDAKKKGASLKERMRMMTAFRKRLKRAGHKLYTYEQKSISLHYSRYLDNFLIGIQGNKAIAKEIQNNIKIFLKSNMHLKISKQILTHSKSNKIA
jgi:retron-type reverse transcriptase